MKFDYNLNNRNKLTLPLQPARLRHRRAAVELVVARLRQPPHLAPFGLNYQNSNYTILENNKSAIGEWNTILGTTMSNSLIVGYSKPDESRGDVGKLFPFVDILQASTVYTTFGSEPFTPNNELRYNTFQLQDSFTQVRRQALADLRRQLEQYHSENVFFPGTQSVYVYNSLAGLLHRRRRLLANPNRTVSPVTLRRFQVR